MRRRVHLFKLIAEVLSDLTLFDQRLMHSLSLAAGSIEGLMGRNLLSENVIDISILLFNVFLKTVVRLQTLGRAA